jgi:hypothetical protein
MFHLGMMFSVLLLAILLGIFYKHHRKKDRYAIQKEGLKHIRNLRLSLYLLQKHRSLTTSHLAGQKDLKHSIEDVQHQVNQIVEDIQCTNKKILINELWISVSEHWLRLSQNYQHHSVDNNILQHNSMIQNLLHLIDDVAFSHELTQLKLIEISNLRLVWKEWLLAIECIGQARAMGSAILAEGSCDSVSRIRLAYLQEKIAEITERAWREIPTSDEQKKQVNRLLACIKIEIINASLSNSMTLTSADYITFCTAVMDDYYQQFDDVLEQLKAA